MTEKQLAKLENQRILFDSMKYPNRHKPFMYREDFTCDECALLPCDCGCDDNPFRDSAQSAYWYRECWECYELEHNLPGRRAYCP